MYTDLSDLTLTGVTAENLNLSDADYSLLLSKITTQAKAIIDGYCMQTFGKIQVTEKYDGNGFTKLFLDNTPIAAIISVSIESEDITSEITLYTTYIYYPDKFSKGIQNITVNYYHGPDQIPEPIKSVSFALCKKILLQFKAEKEAQGLKSEKLGDYQYTIDDSFLLTEDLKLALSPFIHTGGIV